MGELSSGSEKCGIMKMAARASERLVRRTKDGGEQREPRKSGARERASERAVLPRRVNKQGQTTKNQPTNHLDRSSHGAAADARVQRCPLHSSCTMCMSSRTSD